MTSSYQFGLIKWLFFTFVMRTVKQNSSDTSLVSLVSIFVSHTISTPHPFPEPKLVSTSSLNAHRDHRVTHVPYYS